MGSDPRGLLCNIVSVAVQCSAMHCISIVGSAGGFAVPKTACLEPLMVPKHSFVIKIGWRGPALGARWTGLRVPVSGADLYAFV